MLWEGLETFMADAAGPDRRFAIIADVPQWGADPTPCALREVSALLRMPCPDSQLTLSRERYDRLHTQPYAVFREFAAAHRDVATVYPGDHMCSAEGCISKLNGVFLYREGSHLRRNMPVKTNRELAELVHLGDVFNSFVTRPPVEQATPAGPPPAILQLSAKRIEDLLAIKKALDAYHADHGVYPEGIGLRSVVERGQEWIPDLAPKYIAELPRDPARSDSQDSPQYMYRSDTKGFKLIAHGLGRNCGPHVERDGIGMDPARTRPDGTCWAFGFWTEGFETF